MTKVVILLFIHRNLKLCLKLSPRKGILMAMDEEMKGIRHGLPPPEHHWLVDLLSEDL